ncbi:DNA translocase FtsK [Xanthobacter sp. TB0136]|uniref:DNA translocase FtsK n=1 Tax=Xanthobacter sp. TB0136 TaxID=3459177 RepID=UPI00403964F7
MSASNQPPRQVNFPSLLVSEDVGAVGRSHASAEAESSVHTWIDSDFVPSWLRPFSLGGTARFTRTPDHLLRKNDEPELQMDSPGYCIGGAGWHFLDVPGEVEEDLASYPSLKADLEALETAFSDMKGAAHLKEEDMLPNGYRAGETARDEAESFRAESGLIASFVSEELGPAHAGQAEALSAMEDASCEDASYEDASYEDAAHGEMAHEETAHGAAPWAAVEMDGLIDLLETAGQDAAPESEPEAASVQLVDSIGRQMAESWSVRVVDTAGPPAYLLALQQAILLGHADFVRDYVHEPVSRSQQPVSRSQPALDEIEDSGDAVMLSDWDEPLELQTAISDAGHGMEDGDALMLSDFDEEPQAEAMMRASDARPAVAVDERMIAAAIAEAVAEAITMPALQAPAALDESPVAGESAALAQEDEAQDDAAQAWQVQEWEDAFLTYLADEELEETASAPVVEQPALKVEAAAAALVERVADEEAEIIAVADDAGDVIAARIAEAEMPCAADEVQDDADEEALQAQAGDDRVEEDCEDIEDIELAAGEDLDADDDVHVAEEDAAEEVAVEAAAEILHAVPAPVAMDQEAASLRPAAAAFTAPVVSSFFWQPYQQTIGSDLMRFGAGVAAAVSAAPVAVASASPAPQAGASVPALSPEVPPSAALPAMQADDEEEQGGFTGYELPSLDLLSEPPQLEPDYELSEEALDQNSTALQQILRDFGVRGEIIDANPGPVVTLYEFEPAPGVKSSRVIGLADDIARSMSAISARVAVVPGRNVIGIELPNRRRDTVWLRELLSSQEFGEARTKLGIGLGKTIGGEPVIADLARMPHLLVAGTTGSGKSVAINTMILSLLYQHTPEQCRLIMIDPKMLELSIYEGIPHLLTPVVTDPKKAIIALKWAVKEMEDRYRKMARLAVRNIDGYNARMAEARVKGEVITRQVQVGFDKESGEALYEEQEMDLSPLPYIVIIVDEMADLMMVAGKEIEGAIQRLAQMARAAGIHLVMATQRPSVDVITGTIKANFPTRISFQVTSKIDSRTILGEMGAETLLGQGDMLFMAGGGRIQRVHGPFVSDAEVEHVVNFLKTQGGPEYLDDVVTDEEADGPADGDDSAVFDKSALGEGSGDLYDQAVAIVMRDRKASTSYIQRRLQVGYNKAASLMERMENEGIVGPANHAGKREILAFSRGD